MDQNIGMGDDIFDVVDSSDSVVGSARRSIVHAKGLLHRSVHVLIFSREGIFPPICECPECMESYASVAQKRILMQKRSAFKDLNPSLYTTSCSGHVDSGETYDVSVVRELSEETGIKADISDLKKIGKIQACADTGNEFTYVYTMEIPLSQKFEFSPREIDSFEWISIPEFEKIIRDTPEKFTPAFICAYFFWKKLRGGV